MSKRQLQEIEEENLNHELAKKIGISYNDLISTDYEIHEKVSDDSLVYGSYVKFSKESPNGVMQKIKRLDKNLEIHLDN